MPKIINENMVDKIIELRDKGHSWVNIGMQLKINRETAKKYYSKRASKATPTSNAEKKRLTGEVDYAKIFTMFDSGSNPIDIVIEGLCDPDTAGKLWAKFAELKGKKLDNAHKLEELHNLYIKLSDSFYALPITNLNDKWVCNKCGTKGKVAFRIKCTACNRESWWGYFPKLHHHV